MPFLVLFIIPALAGMIAFLFLRGITWKELLVQMAAQAVVAGVSVWAIYHVNTQDTEILSGLVTSKRRVQVACRHPYRCPPCHLQCTGTKTRICTQHCRTCYRHPHDFDWTVFSSLKRETDIPRVDWQGLREPARWTAARVGEPYSVSKHYTNYVKAAPGSLFKRQGLSERYRDHLPEFPTAIYDFYRYNPLVLIGQEVDDPQAWNRELAAINGRVGQHKQVSAVLVLVRDLPQDFFYALEEAWIGGKKNTAALVIGVDHAMAPRWAAVMGWTSSEFFKVHLRDAVMDLPRIERGTLLPILEREIGEYWQRKPMQDFDYLAASIAPTPIQWVVGLIVGLLVCLGLSWVFHVYDVFRDEGLHGGARRG